MKKTVALLFLMISILPAENLLRGFNLSMYSPDTGELTREDFQQMRDIGATLVRLDFSKNHLLEKTPPYNFNEDNFDRLHKYIQWAEKIGLKVVIDPHTFPGTILPWTIMGHDQVWFDMRYKDLVVKLWRRIARECAQYGDVIWAYDLINEPYGRAQQPGQVWDLNELYKELINEIRVYDNSHSIILMFHKRDFQGYAQAPDWYGDPVNKLIYSPHLYWPQQFTFQGLDANLAGSAPGQKYPDPEKGWTREAIGEHLQVYVDFKNKHNVEIFFGEFSCSYDKGTCWDKNDPLRKHPAMGGDQWLIDVIESFEERGFHWTYHCYEDWEGWDATVPHPRWVLMQKFFDPDGPLHPSAHIAAPADNDVFESGELVTILAEAWDEDGDIKLVEFFKGKEKLGSDTSAPFSYDWHAPNGSHRLWVKATDNSGAYRHARPVDIAVREKISAPWTSRDVGTCAAPGSAWQDGDTWVINAIEDDLYSPEEGYHTVTRPFAAGEIIVKVESQYGQEKQNMAGLVLLDSVDKPTIIARIGFCGDNHVCFQVLEHKRYTTSIQSERFAYAPGWLKLVRHGMVVSAYLSDDSETWQQIGAAVHCEFGGDLQAGMFASASKDVFSNHAVFSNFELQNE